MLFFSCAGGIFITNYVIWGNIYMSSSLPIRPEVVRASNTSDILESHLASSGRSVVAFHEPSTESTGYPEPMGVIMTGNKQWEHYRSDILAFCAVSDRGELYVSSSHRSGGIVSSFIMSMKRLGVLPNDVQGHLVSLSDIYKLNTVQVSHAEKVSQQEGDIQENTAVRRLLLKYIRSAAERGASDIHFVADPRNPRIEVRINKILRPFAEEPLDVLNRMLSVAFVGSIDHSSGAYNPLECQTASFVRNELNTADFPDNVDLLRFAWSPLNENGRLLVGRLISNDPKNNRMLEDMGYSVGQLKQLYYMTALTRGAILFCGTMNSGKSSSLRAMVARKMHITRKEISAISVEDPVEGLMPGVKQIPVQAVSRETGSVMDRFVPYMKTALRQDVNMFVVGEIRSLEALNIALEACMSGTQLLSTIHANSVIEAFMRMLLLGVDKYFLGNHRVLTGLVAQCLMPGICPHCRITLEDADERGLIDSSLFDRVSAFLGEINLSPEHIFQRGTGCSHCEYTGQSGLVLAAEVLTTNRQFLERAVDSSLLYQAEEYWLNGNNDDTPSMSRDSVIPVRGFTMQAHALAKMILGLIGPQDVERECGPIVWHPWMKGLYTHQDKPGNLHPDIRCT